MVISRQGLPDLEENVLRHFLGSACVLQHHYRHSKYLRLVKIQQPLQRPSIPALPQQLLNIIVHPSINTREVRAGLQHHCSGAAQPGARPASINERKEFYNMEVAIVIVALIAYLGFRQWLAHGRRVLIHRERLAAIEKGIALPPLEQEVRRRAFNVQRILLLAGLCWISLGIGIFAVLTGMLAHSSGGPGDIPQGFQWIGVAPVAIGLSHLIVYLVGTKKEKE